MRKKILEQRLARINDKISKLKARGLASEDVNEVRAINEQIEDLQADAADVQAEIDAIDEEARSADPAGANDPVPAGAQLVGGRTVASTQRDEAPGSSMEYRQAFMAYIQNGTQIPAELRNGDVISTADTGAAIPTTVMDDVINTVRARYGNLYAKVRKLAVPGGVEIPIGSLQATFKWISESTVSPRQDVGALGKVSFGYHTAEIRIAQTFLSQLLTLSSFEARIAEVIARAYLEAMDYGIVNGSGNGSMLGILNDPRVTNTVTMTAAQFADWTQWRKRFFSQLPIGYRSGEFIFPLSTVESYLETMADDNNNPIFYQATGLVVNDADGADPNGRFFGREISIVESDIIADFDTASAGDVVGIFWQPYEYGINENFGFTMRRYFDEETNEWVDKAIVVVDGKTINPTGFVKIIKG